MRTSGIVAHAVLGARRLSTDPRPLTYDPADVTITASNGQPVKLTEAPVLMNAAGEKVFPKGPPDPYDFAPRDQRTIRIRPADPRYACPPFGPMLELARAISAVPWSAG